MHRALQILLGLLTNFVSKVAEVCLKFAFKIRIQNEKKNELKKNARKLFNLKSSLSARKKK